MAPKHTLFGAIVAIAALGTSALPAQAFGENVEGSEGITYFDFSRIAPTFQTTDKDLEGFAKTICISLGYADVVADADKNNKMYGITTTTNKKIKKSRLDWVFCKK